MSQPTYERLVGQLDRLGLWRAKETLPEALKGAEEKTLGYAAFLDRLLEDEIAAREERRVKSSRRLSGLPVLKSLDTFDFAFQPSLDRAQVLDLASLAFLARKGERAPAGTARRGQDAPGLRPRDLRLPERVLRVLHDAGCDDPRAQYVLSFVSSFPARSAAASTKSQLLVLDEVGYLPLSRAEANYLFQVVSHRYEKSSVILTSNKSVTEWPEVFPRPRDRHRDPGPPAAPQAAAAIAAPAVSTP